MCELCPLFLLPQPSTEGYIAVILPKFEESKRVTEGLLTREQYEEVLAKRNQQEEPCWDQLTLRSCWLTESLLKNNCFKQVKKHQWHHGYVPLTFQKIYWENDNLEWRLVCWIQNSLGFHWSAFSWTTIHEMRNDASVMGIV